MFNYHLSLALRSLVRNPGLTLLMVASIGVGIGASMTTFAVFRAMDGDPIAYKASQLYVPQIQNWDPDVHSLNSSAHRDGLSDQLSYIDAIALMRAHAAPRQTALYETRFAVTPPDPQLLPFQVGARAGYADLFAMFDVPFAHGGPWSAADDQAHAPVAVISHALNDKVFGGGDSVGKVLWLDGQDYRVVGVLRDWNPVPRFYDLQDAFGIGPVTNAYPLTGSGSTEVLSLDPEQLRAAPAAQYFGDEQTLRTLGLRLIAGRNFRAEEVTNLGSFDNPHPAGLIITQALARKLSPDGDALGRGVYMEGQRGTTPIIGIVARLQVPWTRISGWGSAWSDSSIVVPFRNVSRSAYYIVRAQPGRLAALMKSAPRRLVALNRDRVIDRVQSFQQARAVAYRDDRGLAVILAVVCAVLLVVTAFGIVGLTSYWVAQRRRQIGIRRALGATRVAIVRHFQAENLIIAAAGGIAGIALGVGANLWMVSSFATARLPLIYLLAGVAVVLGLGQLAALRPALRAASVPPAEATRTS